MSVAPINVILSAAKDLLLCFPKSRFFGLRPQNDSGLDAVI